MDLPADYDSFFNNRLVFITGVARSGTTIVGKILGSFSNTYYCYEPSSVRVIPPLIQKKYLEKKLGTTLFKGILFEDLFLQIIHGRYVNFNKKDDSYIGNYVTEDNVKLRWEKYKRRIDIVKDLELKNCLFVTKIPDIQPSLDVIKNMFDYVKFIHIIRDGNNVISSSIRKDFYSEDFLNNRSNNWGEMFNDLRVPWFINKKEREKFYNWNRYTRIAYIWRVLTQKGINFERDNKSCVMQFKLEDFIKSPEEYVKNIEKFVGEKRTDITLKHIDSIKKHKNIEYKDVTKYIEAPEKDEYIKFRKKLGY